jgi:predicted metal-dependent hydrolase
MTKDECAELPPPLVLKGIEEFNRGKFFEQHETLETAWRAESRPVRGLYQGILQIGLACYQIERGNLPGAHKMFERGLRRLRPFEPGCLGIDVARLIADAERVRDESQKLGPGRLHELDRALFPNIAVREARVAETRRTTGGL